MQIPESRTVPDLLDEMARRYPDVEAVVGGERRLTYAGLREEARRFARGLHDLGVRRGDHVAILMGNQAEWLVADFAILALGATMVSVNTWATRRELAYMLDHSDASVLVCADRFLGQDYLSMLRDLDVGAGGLPELRHVVCLGSREKTLANEVMFDEVAAGADHVPEDVVDAAQRATGKNDVAYILYTSGSTSTPKGVQLQHFALIENMWHIGERQHLRRGDRLWLGVSLFWGLGCENALFALMTHAGTIVLQKHFEPGEAISLIERERCTVIYATPNMVHAIAEHPDYSPEAVATLRTGATIGTPEQIERLAHLGPTEICNIYGLTETYGNCAVADAHDPLETRKVSVGRPLPGVDVIIVDPETHAPAPQGEPGEIRVKGYVTCGYYKDEDKNRAAFDERGYFRTGDLGLLDETGRLHFRGRIKEMIKTGGINVAPIEVEEILMAHTAVMQAFVIGLPDAEREEIVAAVIVPHAPDDDDVEALRSHCRQALATYKCPRRYAFVAPTELPLTTTGKVRKLSLVDLFD